MKTGISTLVCLGLLVFTSGCTQEPTPVSQVDEHQDEHGHDHHDHDHSTEAGHIADPVAPSAEGEKYVLATAPDDALSVIGARESVKNDDEVVLFGRIGGSENPWIEGRAMFTVVDDSLKPCNEIPGDNCPTPWDYCCDTEKLKTSTALVKVVDENGNPVKTDARELLGVRELTKVTVQGKAQRDDAGNLTVLATAIHVQK